MIEFSEYQPNPIAPIVLVDKVLGLYRVSPALVKVTFGLTTTIAGGAQETMERVSLVWEPAAVARAQETFNWAFNEWKNGTFADVDNGGRLPRTQ